MFIRQAQRGIATAFDSLLHAGLIVGILVFCPESLRAEGAKPQQLFDGSTFRGWEGDVRKTWRIEKGAIAAGSHEQSAPRNEFLSTTREFSNFELRVRFKVEGDENINAGIQFRTARIPDHHEVSGYQADIGPEVDGHLYDESRRRQMLASPDPETLKEAQQAAPDDGWQTYRIRAVGNRIELWLNGVQTVDYVEKDENIATSGIIALQIHGGMKGIIYYKELEILELPEQLLKSQALQARDVKPIDWRQFSPSTTNRPLQQAAEMLQRSARYNLAWIEREFELNEEQDTYVLREFDEHGVRPACSTAYGTAVLLKSGAFNAPLIGLSKAEAQQRAVRLLRGIVRTHAANSSAGESWGALHPASEPRRHWQSSLWAALAGMGGWLLWDDLDTPTQEMVVRMLERESKRFFVSDYRVPYWNGEGGDTKAEENSWNSMHLALLAAMMPEHPHATAWKSRCSELILSAYATREDWQANATMLDGRPVKEWLRGYNAEPGGVVVNHDFIHPDYMAAISMNFWALTTQSLARRPAPESWDFNAPLVYGTLVSKSWNSPPYEKPGGTIYKPGIASVYYPQGNDWSYHDLTLYYLMDVYAHQFDWHPKAPEWTELRAKAMLGMQRRHEDGRMFAAGEYDSYPGCEQLAFWCLADAYLPQWLGAQGMLSKKNNWLIVKPIGNRHE